MRHVAISLLATVAVALAQGVKETPVTVEDGGSIIISIPSTSNYEMTAFGPHPTILTHPDTEPLRCVYVTSGKTAAIPCTGCKVTFESTDAVFGQIRISATTVTGNRMTLTTTVPYDNPKWGKTTTSMKLDIPGKFSNVAMTDANGTRSVCGANCKVRLSTRSCQ